MKIKKTAIVIISIFVLTLIYGTTLSKAALQANENTPVQKDLGTWMSSIRDMEATGGTLGLSETKDVTTLLPTSESNNLDAHMEKNSEYGAMAILSASSYGKQTPIADGETTTGNKSGVVIKLNKEWVAAGILGDCANYAGADPRYKDVYTAEQKNKNGDALLETKGWHSSKVSDWFSDYYKNINDSGMWRAASDSLFSYSGSSYKYNSNSSYYKFSFAARACIVVGSEL